MKGKIVNLSVALVLILACVVSFVIDNAGTTVGAGMGKNARVNSVEELTDVLKFVANRQSISNFTLYSSIDDGTSDNEKTESEAYDAKHSSATVHISTRLKSESSVSPSLYENQAGQTYRSTSLERELTLYLTESSTYYESDGVMQQKSTSKRKDDEGNWVYKDYNTLFRFNMEIFVTADKTYMRIHEFNLINDSESRIIKSEYTGKWIAMPYEIIEDFVDIDNWNRDVMTSLGEMIDFLMGEGAISKSDSSVSFNEKELKEIFEDAEGSVPYSPEDYKIDFNIDLSNSTAPVITLNEVLDSEKHYEEATHGVTGSQTNKAKMEQVVIIKNIDNTVAEVKDFQVSVAIETAEDSEKIFTIEEADNDDD